MASTLGSPFAQSGTESIDFPRARVASRFSLPQRPLRRLGLPGQQIAILTTTGA
jgi:hypothetical protein